MKDRLLRVAALLFLVVCLVVAPHASAQTKEATKSTSPTPIVPGNTPTTGIDLTVSPIFLNLITDPGKSVNSSVRVTNNSNVTEYLRVSLARFVPQATGNPVIANVEPNEPFAQWISFSEPEFVLAPNETKTIRVTINPSNEASLGYYYAMVVSRMQEQDATAQPVVAGSPAVPILLEIRTANAKREVQLVDFKTDAPFYEYLPTNFQIKLKNSGNIHVAPIGDIFIDWGSSQDVATIPVNYAKGNILPGSERTYEAVWDDSMIVRVPKTEDGQTTYETKVDFDKPLSKFRFGKYTANLLLIYDNGERDIPLEASVSFWVIPWRIILGVLAVIIAPFILFLLLNRMKRRKK